MKWTSALVVAAWLLSGCGRPPQGVKSQGEQQAESEAQAQDDALYANYQLADAHFHLSNYVGQGGSLKDILHGYMGQVVGRSTVMPIPLQQKWDGFEHFQGDRIKPTYYLGPKSELYYYSFIDAMVAHEYGKLESWEKRHFDPMITGFNPMDRYAVNHVKRVLLTSPGVFSGVGEFTVHKELVSDKLAGNLVSYIAGPQTPPDALSPTAKLTLYEEALADLLTFTAEAGLVAVLHNDVYESNVQYDGTVLSLSPTDTAYTTGLKALCAVAPKAKVVWAHTGLGRFVKPAATHLASVADVLDSCPNWSVDISWDLVQTYIMTPVDAQPAHMDWVNFITKYQDRVLFGSDNVFFTKTTIDASGNITPGHHQSPNDYLAVATKYQDLWSALGPAVAKKVQRANYEGLYDAARVNVRKWEADHASDDVWNLQ